MSELLDQTAIDAALSGLDGWTGGPDRITRTAELPSFPVAITVVDRVAAAAEKAAHHPDIDIRWRTVTFACATHSAGGVTAKDLALAARIDEIVRAAGQDGSGPAPAGRSGSGGAGGGAGAAGPAAGPAV